MEMVAIIEIDPVFYQRLQGCRANTLLSVNTLMRGNAAWFVGTKRKPMENKFQENIQLLCEMRKIYMQIVF